MKVELIMLDNPIIVTDQEIKVKDWSYSLRDGWIKQCINPNPELEKELQCVNIIAGLPELSQIDWNGLEAEFGYVDVESIVKDWYNHAKYLSSLRADPESFVQGFKKAQELNDKKFSLEDMDYAYICGRTDGETNVGNKKKQRELFIQSLSKPRTFKIEAEKEYLSNTGEWKDVLLPSEWEINTKIRPKITDGKIKIIKKL